MSMENAVPGLPQVGNVVGAAASGHRSAVLIAAGIASGLLLLGGIVLVVWYLRSRRRERTAPRGITPTRLRQVWERFLLPLPLPVRAALPEHDHFIVLGDPGVGKSAAITRRVDWQGQTSLFLPSYTPDPLLQIYLGSHAVVQEVSATLLQQTSRESHEAFRRLWKTSLSAARPPTVVVVLKISTLQTSSPDVIRQQAQLVRGKINLLSELFATPIRTRLCVTNMERVRGYSEFSRFLHKSRLPLVLEVGTDAQGGLLAALQSYEKAVPRALTTLAVGSFESTVQFLSSAPEVITPVSAFITALSEGSVASVRPHVQQVYFFSLPPDEDVGNPFASAGLAPGGAATVLSRWQRWLRGLGIKPLHAALSLLLFIGGIVPIAVWVRRHGQRVQQSSTAVADFAQSVRRAQESLNIPSESDVVRRAELAAVQKLVAVESAEAASRPLRLLLRAEKADARQRYVQAVRQGYLRPALESGIRQRARDKILYALAAMYATRDNSLGALVRTQPQDFATTLGLPVDVLNDYVSRSDVPWNESALLLLPPLPSESARWPIADLRPWQELVRTVALAIPQPVITTTELERLRKEADHLREALERVRKATALRRIYQMLGEESPLDMVKLLGTDAGVLTPEPWLRDNTPALEKFLGMVRDSSLELQRAGKMSLFQLLKWINSLGSSGKSALGPAGGISGAPLEEDLIQLAFPGNKLIEVSQRGWLELLLRSRKRILLTHRVNSATVQGAPRRTGARCCGCTQRTRHRHRHHCVPCPDHKDSAAAELSGGCPSRRPSRHSAAAPPIPPFTSAELEPRLAALATSDQAPDEHLAPEYNRVLFDSEVLPLVRELKKALADSKALSPEEKLKLAHLVRQEIDGYAQKYCAALLKFYLSFHFSDDSSADLHTALLNLVKPGSRFVAHLNTVADNASPRGLDEAYLAPLAACLAEYQPLVRVMAPPAAGKNAGPKASAAETELEGLKPYLSAVFKQAELLDKSALAREDGSDKKDAAAGKGGDKPSRSAASATLGERVGPVGRSALLMREAASDSPRTQAEQFLDKAGIVGALRRPFLEPFSAVYHRGARELERTMAEHWQTETLPLVAPLLARFPFNQAAEREVAPTELDILSEPGGAFWQDVRAFYFPAVSEQSGTFLSRTGGLGALALPKDFLPTVNQLAKLARTLFDDTGKRQPLRFAVRGLPGSRVSDGKDVQPTIAFLQVGKAAVFGFNQRATSEPIAIDWWNQGVALVGIESAAPRSGRKHTETLEVADSAWSLYRLLQKTTLDSDGISTWRILGNGPQEGQVIRFGLQPDPWAPFRIKLP